MARKVDWVVLHGIGRNLIGRSGATVSDQQVESTAVTAGQTTAKADQPRQLGVHKPDGAIEYDYTYGDDPYPPKG